jgi:phosphoribosylformylglycinamidine cyclo-ligase
VSSETYRRAGVDLDAAAEAVARIREVASVASRPEVADGVGGFAGRFALGDGRFLAAATDGVGTKLEIARRTGRLDTVGIDLVAMCADDVVCTGAEPLFFLDYLAVGRVHPEHVAAIVGGVAEGCRLAGCALLGGETAEHPGVMEPDAFDLAGFCVGIVDERSTIGPERVSEGDVLVGLASSGLHANGYSLVREALLGRAGYELDEELPRLGRPLADELLEPTRIYAPLVLELARSGRIHAAAHVTGGGLIENVPRMLPEGSGAQLREASWPVPPIVALIGEAADASADDLRRTFNLGIGMVVATQASDADEIIAVVADAGVPAYAIGVVVEGAGVAFV